MPRVASCYRRAGARARSCHHTDTEQETHFGEKVRLSLKGAIDAHEGVMGPIPGRGQPLVRGRGQGNRVALCSAPHGAGREYSRSRARKTFAFAQLGPWSLGRRPRPDRQLRGPRHTSARRAAPPVGGGRPSPGPLRRRSDSGGRGATSALVSAWGTTETIWQFFAAHPAPA